MDSGLAAVLGALAGAAGTVGAGFATGWAQRQVARIAASTEHIRQRREPREQVYKDFAEAVSQLRDLKPSRGFTESTVDPELVNAYRITAAHIKKKWLEVALAGPESVSEIAGTLEQQAQELAQLVYGFNAIRVSMGLNTVQPGIDGIETFDEYGRLVQSFITKAQAALDDDGIKKRSR